MPLPSLLSEPNHQAEAGINGGPAAARPTPARTPAASPAVAPASGAAQAAELGRSANSCPQSSGTPACSRPTPTFHPAWLRIPRKPGSAATTRGEMCLAGRDVLGESVSGQGGDGGGAYLNTPQGGMFRANRSADRAATVAARTSEPRGEGCSGRIGRSTGQRRWRRVPQYPAGRDAPGESVSRPGSDGGGAYLRTPRGGMLWANRSADTTVAVVGTGRDGPAGQKPKDRPAKTALAAPPGQDRPSRTARPRPP
jgi:hypothetical protein